MKLLEKLLAGDLMSQVHFIIKAAAVGTSETEAFKEKLLPLEVERGSGGALEYEKALRLTLKLVSILLEKRDDFLRVLRWAENPVNASDVCVILNECVEYLPYFVNYPYDDEVCLFSVRIMKNVCQRNSCAVVKMMIRRPDRERKILTAFHKRLLLEEALDQEELEEIEQEGAVGRGGGDGSNRRALNDSVRYALLRMILDCIHQPSLNISHFLLGFRTHSDTPGGRKNALVMYDENALGSIIFWLQNKASLTRPEMIESCFEILYSLCSDERTSEEVLQLLRNRWNDFYLFHLSHFWSGFGWGKKGGSNLKCSLRQVAFFLRTIALEIRATSHTDQKSGSQDCKRMLSLLFDNDHLSLSSNAPYSSFFSPDPSSRSLPPDSFPQKMNLLSLLDTVSIQVAELDDSALKSPMSTHQSTTCQVRDHQGVLVYDIQLLLRELTRMDVQASEASWYGKAGVGFGVVDGRGAVSGGQDFQTSETVREMLAFAVRVNDSRQLMAARDAALSGWKSIVEVSLVNCLGALLTSQRQPLVHSFLDLIAPMLRILSGLHLCSFLLMLSLFLFFPHLLVCSELLLSAFSQNFI